MAYLGVFGERASERTIEKSRFLTYTAQTEGEDAAREFLARVRAAHPLATHVCFGYIADATGNLQRFSDDGEPQGTAGIPILNVIKAQKLFCTAVAVVRYFGGIKLGAGGLTRAYAGCAAEGLAQAEKREFDLCAELIVTVGYSEVNACTRFLAGERVISREFGERAAFTVAVRERELPAFRAGLADYLNGKAAVAEQRRYLYPFPATQSE